MKTLFHPMLAAKLPVDANLRSLTYPLLASYKLDGVRATKQEVEGPLMSRNDERIPNKHVQKLFKNLPPGFDGELGCGEPTAPDFFRKTMSAVMSVEGTPDVTFYIFGVYDCSYTFAQRQKLISEWYKMYGGPKKPMAHVKVVEQVQVCNAFELEEFEKLALALGYEGVMLAKPDGKYKQGGKHPRSTLKEFYLVKLKRFAHAEATIVGCTELMHNYNVKLAGKSRKQTLKENMRPSGMLGAFVVQSKKWKPMFEVGTGFTTDERLKYFPRKKIEIGRTPDNQIIYDAQTLTGKIVRYSYFPTGSKDKPRFPVFDGFRDRKDL